MITATNGMFMLNLVIIILAISKFVLSLFCSSRSSFSLTSFRSGLCWFTLNEFDPFGWPVEYLDITHMTKDISYLDGAFTLDGPATG
jgi:amino acid permease